MPELKERMTEKAWEVPEKWVECWGTGGGPVPGSPGLCPGAEVLVGLKKARGFSFSVQKREVRTIEDQGCDEQKGERTYSSIFNCPIWPGGRSLCPK